MATSTNAINNVKPAAQNNSAAQTLAQKMNASKGLVAGFWIVTALLLPGDELHCLLRATASGGPCVRSPRLHGHRLPHRALVGQAGGCSRVAVAHGPCAVQGMGLRRIRHQPDLGDHRPSLYPRCPPGTRAVIPHQRALGILVLPVAPLCGPAGKPDGHSGTLLIIAVSVRGRPTHAPHSGPPITEGAPSFARVAAATGQDGAPPRIPPTILGIGFVQRHCGAN